MNTLLTDIEHPGTQIVPTDYKDRHTLAMHIDALRAQGHAIVVDETFEPGRKEERCTLRVFHYATCRACRKGAV